MLCTVIKTFRNGRGETIPPGSTIEIPDQMLLKMTDYVQPVGQADNHLPEKGTVPAVPAPSPVSDWRPPFKAWLVNDELRSTGTTDDLAGAIIELTANDLPLQRRLLKLHCGVYQGPWWDRLVERWQERAGIMQFDGGLSREEAERQAAECLRATAFLDELKKQQ